MLQKKAIHVVSPRDTPQSFGSTTFLVPKKGGAQRPVVNICNLNQFLPYRHFKMEGIHMLRDLLRKIDFLVMIDLNNAYFTIPTWKRHQKYLRFIWKGTMYEFAYLPFSMSSIPRVFTKLMEPAVCLLRQLGTRFNIYLDDILFMAPSRTLTLQHALITLDLLERL